MTNYFFLTIDTTQVQNDVKLREALKAFQGVEFQAGSWLLTADSMDAIYQAVLPVAGQDNVTIFPVRADDLRAAHYVNSDLREYFQTQGWTRAA